jgi:hypothetical protein
LKTRFHSLLALGAWVLLLLLMAPNSAQSSDLPPEVIDRDRSVRNQSEARGEALDQIREGLASGSPQVVVEYLGDASGMVRDAAYSQLRRFSAEQLDQVVKFRRQGSAKESPQTRDLVDAGLAEALFHQPRPEAAGWLLSVAASRKSGETSRELALSALAQLPSGSLDQKSLRTLIRLAEKEPSWWIRGEALRSLSRLDPKAAGKPIDKAWNDARQWPLRLVSLQAQAVLDPGVAIERATALLSEEIRDRKGIWGGRIERAALHLLGEEVQKLPRPDRVATIELLIARALDSDSGTWRPEIPVLRQLTGVDLTSDRATAWDSWWKSRREQWIQEDGKSGTAEGKPAEDDGETRVVEYHGLPIDSQRIVFVSDVSGGMSRTLDGEFDGSGPRRLEVARQELLRVLGELPAESWVQVIYFASLRIPLLPAPQLLARCHKVLKKRILDQGVPQGRGEARGNLYGPLRAALLEPGIDTVILLTEGAATEGRIHDGDRLCWHVQRWNRWSRVRVHVLSVGRLSSGNRAFLEKLARENGGEFHDIDDRLGKSESGR